MSAQDLAKSKSQGGPGFVLHGRLGSGAGCLGSLCSLHPRRSAGPKSAESVPSADPALSRSRDLPRCLCDSVELMLHLSRSVRAIPFL